MGDAATGEALFAQVSADCSNCHKADRTGGNYANITGEALSTKYGNNFPRLFELVTKMTSSSPYVSEATRSSVTSNWDSQDIIDLAVYLMTPEEVSPPPAEIGDAVAGAALFDAKCSSCHANGFTAAAIAGYPGFDALLDKVISMGSFVGILGGTLSDAEAEDITAYLRAE